MKRQRFLARQQAEGGGAGGGYEARRRPPELNGAHLAPNGVHPGPPSPISRYLPELQEQSHSGGMAGAPYPAAAAAPSQGPAYADRGYSATPTAGQGFDARVAGQWNANVVGGLRDRQEQHDPARAGPYVPPGGQRVTQDPGGPSAVDLSWGAQQGGGHPPRAPSSGSAPSHGRAAPPWGTDDRREDHSQHHRMMRGASPSHHSRAAGGAAPFGRDDDAMHRQGQPPRRPDAAPWSQDGGAAPPRAPSRGRSEVAYQGYGGAMAPAGAARTPSQGARQASPMNRYGAGAPAGASGASPSQGAYDGRPPRGVSPSHGAFDGRPPAGAAAGAAGGARGRPPGGGSSIVFG